MRKSVFALLAAILALAFCSVSFADAPDDGWDRCSEEWGEEHWENGEWDGALRGYVLCNTLTLPIVFLFLGQFTGSGIK